MTATRLYTKEYFLNDMSNEGIPEIQRSNMVSCIIQLKALGIDNILGFDWLASLSAEAMIPALEILYSLRVLDDDAKLTSPTGFQVAEIPLDLMVSKMIIASSQLGCSEEIITIAAVLSVQEIVPKRILQMEEAIRNCDFASFSQLTCADSNQFHAVCLDTCPPIFYKNVTSHRIISIVEKWNRSEEAPQV